MRKTIGRDLPNGDYVEITVQERDGSDGLGPGFSITCLGWERRGTWPARANARNGRDAAYAGAAHDVILAAAPELAPVIAVHLADRDGVPMHALANGWYFYRGGGREYELRHYGQEWIERQGTDHERAARALHIPPGDLPEGLSESEFRAFVESLADRWRDQAAAAREVISALVDGDGVEDRKGGI